MMIAGKPLKKLLWPILTMVMGLVCLLLLILLLFTGGDALSKRAYDEGRRMAVSLQTGAIDGLPLMTPEGNIPPATLPEQQGTTGELPAVTPHPGTTPVAPPKMEEALPGNFGSDTDEAPLPVPAEDIEAKKEKPAEPDYPVKVPQEPETKKTSESAPLKPVEANELPQDTSAGQEGAAATETPFYPPGKPMTIAPNPQMVQKSPQGDLPIVTAEGVRPADYYAKPFDMPVADKAVKQPVIAIIMSGLGLGRYTTEEAMKLPPEITFSLSPYAQDGALWAKHARDHGHEILVDLPTQPLDYPATDPGPYALMNTLSADENLQRLYQVMSRFSGYVGFLTSTKAAVPELVVLQAMKEIGKRGLLLVDQPGPAADALQNRKKDLGVVDISTSVLIDEHLNDTAISNALAALAEMAKTNGQVIAVARPYPITVKHLRQWSAELQKQGVLLVPVSVIAKRSH